MMIIIIIMKMMRLAWKYLSIFWTTIKRELSACYFLPYVSTKAQLPLDLIG